MRTLTGLVAGRPFRTMLSGDESLARRPMRRVVEPLRAMGAHIDGRDDGAFPPLTVAAARCVGSRTCSPVASAPGEDRARARGLQASGSPRSPSRIPSRDHTERMLTALGAPLERVDAHHDAASAPARRSRSRPRSPAIRRRPRSGWSARLITPGSEVVVEGVACNPTRIAFVDVLRRMGADVEVEITGEVLGRAGRQHPRRDSGATGTTIAGAEIALVQDEIPALAVAAAFADGVTEIRDAAELRSRRAIASRPSRQLCPRSASVPSRRPQGS